MSEQLKALEFHAQSAAAQNFERRQRTDPERCCVFSCCRGRGPNAPNGSCPCWPLPCVIRRPAEGGEATRPAGAQAPGRLADSGRGAAPPPVGVRAGVGMGRCGD